MTTISDKLDRQLLQEVLSDKYPPVFDTKGFDSLSIVRELSTKKYAEITKQIMCDKGYILEPSSLLSGRIQTYNGLPVITGADDWHGGKTCPACDGAGKVKGEECWHCEGEGIDPDPD